jgi:uncharacterized protein
MHGTFVWNELASTEPEAAMAFYAATLGWTFEEFPLPEGRYWVARLGERLVAGIGGLETSAIATTTSHWFAFIQVDDVDARIAAARAQGAAILRAPHDVPEVGRVAVLQDPTGAPIGWMSESTPGG